MPDGPLNSLMIQADRYAKDRPDDLGGIVDRYWQVVNKGRGTPIGEEAQR